MKTIARRTFLIGSAVVAGGLVVGVWRYKTPYANPLVKDLKPGDAALTPYVRIDQSGVTIITPRAEMGQGVQSTLAAMVAEELDVSLDAINIEHGPASKAYFNSALLEEAAGYPAYDLSASAERARGFTKIPAKFLGLQITGGSTSTVDGFDKMRTAGAAARHMLLDAAAAELGVDKAQLSTDDGAVVAPDGQRLDYTTLAVAAADFDPPDNPALIATSDWKLLGKSQPRLDMVEKTTGTAEYAIDVRLPEMLYATVRMNPNLGAGLRSFDDSAARSMPGVKDVIELNGGIAVVATNTWYAFKAAAAVECDWETADYPADTDGHYAVVQAAFDDEPDSELRNDGDVESALIEGADVEAEYRVPYLAHATMEPMNAVAWLHDDQLDIWAGTQFPTQAVKEGADIADIDAENVNVHTTYLGGGFGRRSEMDFIQYAVHVAKAMRGFPVKVTWSREEDMRHGTYRPPAMARFRANVSDGVPTAIDLQLSAPSVTESQLGRIGLSAPGPDPSIVQAAWDQPYAVDHYRVRGYRPPIMLPITYWRSVGASQNGFFHECMLDEIAHAANVDPLDMRLSMLMDDTSRKVLEAAADMASWGGELPVGHARGLAFVMSFGVPTAEIIEVANTDNGIKLVNAWAAVDVGTALDPRNIEGQVISGINFGLTAAIMGDITVQNGQVVESNFHNYDAIRMMQAPPIEVRILENSEAIRGIGEPGTPPAAPALANAIFAATGRRIRELPLNKHIDFA